MAGLSVLLESNKNRIFFNGRRSMSSSPTKIVSNTAITRPSLSSSSSASSSSSFSSSFSSGFVAGAEVRPFLHQCLLCKRRLLENEDIYMYMGEMAFCSADCRLEYMATEADGSGDRHETEGSDGRSTQISNTSSSSAGNAGKHSVFSADYSPPKHEGKRTCNSRANGGIAC